MYKYLMKLIGEKVGYAVQCGLKVIVCVGEKLSEREAGQTEEFVNKQLKAISGMLVYYVMGYLAICSWKANSN